ncbi:MAG: hypothetical protein IKM03_02940 [Alistipes sp.]|nr:hypothetical protein [Alistipes sp.]
MENTKLQQLTDKLYQQGLEKGRAEADNLVAAAKSEAQKIVADAEARAAKIIADAENKAADVEKNAMTEISLAGKQAVAKIKAEIENLVVAKATSEGVKKANLDVAFIKDMLLAVAKNWNNGAKVELSALLPEAKKAELNKEFEAVAKALLAEGVELGFAADVKSGFKVGEKKGGYYISFSDEAFEALLGGYLREKVAKLLF